MKPIQELQNIFDSIHNESSTATQPAELKFETEQDTWFDKLILRWF